ncbi:MAG: hypothetical protein KDA61_22420, partial [Planctomycetales bacterium]|nr:hypothetical protein [Planctomycetales bacterium]
MATISAASPRSPRAWIVGPWWDLGYVVLTPVAIVPIVLLASRRWFSPEAISLAVIAFASLGHHLPGFLRAYGERDLRQRYRWRLLLAPLGFAALTLSFSPPARLAAAMGWGWSHLHGLELILLVWGAWHGLMQTYGFMRIYDLRRGENNLVDAWLDQALCACLFIAAIVWSDSRMFGIANAMWQSGLPIFDSATLEILRWITAAALISVAVAYGARQTSRVRKGLPLNWQKMLLAGLTGWFYWFCGSLSTNLLIGVAMFEIYHAIQYDAIVWIYDRRLLSRASERLGSLGW